MSRKREIRMLSTALRVETRADGENERNVLVGHAAVFNQRTNLGYFDEVVKRGAFRNSLRDGADVRALVDHDPSRIIARTKDGGKTGTLRLREDRVGLRAEIEVADTQAGRDIMESIRRGDVDGMSFGFFVRDDGETVKEEKSGRILRELRDLDLFDVSVVTFPAYPQTDLAEKNSAETAFEVRSINEVFEELPEELRAKAEMAFDTDAPDMALEAEEIRQIVREEVLSILENVAPQMLEERSEEEPQPEDVEPQEGGQRSKAWKRLELERLRVAGEADSGLN